jgi:hypothetical protein
MRIPKRGILIEVKWLDAFDPKYGQRWMRVDKIVKKEKCVIRSAGYVFAATKQYLIISRETAKRQRAGIFYIPLGCVQKVRVLK